MAFINNNSIVNNTNTTTERKVGDFFIKTGYAVKVPEQEEPVIVSLPFDTDIESMPSLKVTASEGWVNQLNIARNQLRTDILEAVQDMEPGETRELNLKVFVYRRTNKEVKQMDKENPFARRVEL